MNSEKESIQQWMNRVADMVKEREANGEDTVLMKIWLRLMPTVMINDGLEGIVNPLEEGEDE